MTTTPLSFSGEEDFKMIKKFYIVSCAALVACLCLFSQGAGATARQSEATAVAPGASAGAPIQLAQGLTTKKKAKREAKKPAPRLNVHPGFPLSITIQDKN